MKKSKKLQTKTKFTKSLEKEDANKFLLTFTSLCIANYQYWWDEGIRNKYKIAEQELIKRLSKYENN